MQLVKRIKKLEGEFEKQNNTCSSEWWHYLRSVKRANCEHPKDSFRCSVGRQEQASRKVRSFFCLDCGFEGTFWKTNLLSIKQAVDLHLTQKETQRKGEEMELVFIEEGLLSYFFWDDSEKISDELIDNNLHGIFSKIWELDMLHLAECFKNEHYKKYSRKTKNEH